MKNKKYESGRSMIEMVGVLAIMGLLTAAAFALIQSGIKSQKVSKISDEIDMLVSHARALTAEMGNFKSLPLKTDVASNRESKPARLAGRIVGMNPRKDKTPIGGMYELYKADEDGEEFVVEINGITDKDDCYMMKYRSYADGTADCLEPDGDSAFYRLTITYTK